MKIQVQILFTEPKTVTVFMEKEFVGAIQLKKIIEGCKQVKVLFAKRIECSPDYCYFKSIDGMTIGVPSDFLVEKIGGMFDPVFDKLEAAGHEEIEGISLNIDQISKEIPKAMMEKVANEKKENEQEPESEMENDHS